MEKEVVIPHKRADFVLNASRNELYQLGIYPLRCRVCGLQKPNIIAEAQSDVFLEKGNAGAKGGASKGSA
jgi:hypothetical protein